MIPGGVRAERKRRKGTRRGRHSLDGSSRGKTWRVQLFHFTAICPHPHPASHTHEHTHNQTLHLQKFLFHYGLMKTLIYLPTVCHCVGQDARFRKDSKQIQPRAGRAKSQDLRSRSEGAKAWMRVTVGFTLGLRFCDLSGSAAQSGVQGPAAPASGIEGVLLDSQAPPRPTNSKSAF